MRGLKHSLWKKTNSMIGKQEQQPHEAINRQEAELKVVKEKHISRISWVELKFNKVEVKQSWV